jgi:hypothetical protein
MGEKNKWCDPDECSENRYVDYPIVHGTENLRLSSH